MNTPSIRTPEEILAKTREELEREAALPLPSGAASSEPSKAEGGEWTPEWLRQYTSGYSSFDLAIKGIADAHNAEIKAEREKRKPLVEALTKLRDVCTPPTDKRELVEWTGLIFSSAVKEICDKALASVKDGK